eukprot:6882802-Prymnesium_polylepis.2
MAVSRPMSCSAARMLRGSRRGVTKVWGGARCGVTEVRGGARCGVEPSRRGDEQRCGQARDRRAHARGAAHRGQRRRVAARPRPPPS